MSNRAAADGAARVSPSPDRTIGDAAPHDREARYRAVRSRDRRFDGAFYTAVQTTGIYCRPSCPARTPALRNVRFYPTAAAAQLAGFRACKRCLPDATPGSPDWDVAADVAGRAMRLISDGVVDREGVGGLAHRLGYTPRHLGRLLIRELGAAPLPLARARRAQTARTLIEATDLPFAEIALAAGFASIRQFNDTVREVYDASPTALRRRRATRAAATTGGLTMRLAVRTPFAGSALLRFLAARAIDGVERIDGDDYLRTLALPHGTGTVRVRLANLADTTTSGRGAATAYVPATFRLSDLRDTAAAVERVRRLLDADCDPVAVTGAFRADPILGPRVRSTPGLRVPGHVDGDEAAIRAVLGQQVTIAAARTAARRLTQRHGRALPEPVDGLTHLFPSAGAIAAVDPATLPMPRSRASALIALAAALADGNVALDRSADRDLVRRDLLALPGIGPWTADYITLRALGHPDVFLATDVGVRRALAPHSATPRTIEQLAERWRPWRSYALTHLWHAEAAATD